MNSVYDRRTSALWLGPIALLAVAGAVAVLANGTIGGRSTKNKTDVPVKTVKVKVGTTKRTTPAYYKVRQGDVLSVIAERFGISVDRLQQLNPTLDPRLLRPGMRLRLR